MAKRDRLPWLLLGSLLAACAQPKPAEPEVPVPEPAAAPAAEDALTFTGLVMRDCELWLLVGPHGPLYTVKSKDGKVLADRIDDARLAADYPVLHERLHNTVDY